MPKSDFNMPHYVLLRGEQILQRLLEQIWTSLLVVVVLAGVAAIMRIVLGGWQSASGLHLGLVVLYLAATALRKRLTQGQRAGFLLGYFTAVGISGVLVFGFVAAGIWWLVLGTVLANVFFSGRPRVLYSAFVFVLIVLVGMGFVSGWLTLPYDPVVYVRQPFTWIGIGVGCVLLSVLIFAAIATYQRTVVELLHEVDHNRQQKEVLIKEQEKALAEIRRLQGFIPICAHCKKIRDDKGYWENVEAYVQKHADVQFSHCLCPPCGHELYGDEWDQAMRDLALEPGGKAEA